MAELFVDTSAWYPIADLDHPDHGRLARALREQIDAGVRIVTTNLVLAESHALILRRIHRAAAPAFLAAVREPPNVVVFSTPELEAAAERDWLAAFEDQRFSLTDAVSFAVMTERGTDAALALDRHFRTAGFVAIP